MRRTCIAVLCLGFLSGAPARGQATGVTVHKAPPTVAQRTFDPKRPPKDLPVMVPGEAGLTHYEYTTDIAVAGDIDTLGPGSVNLIVDTADINLSLPITVWLETNAPKNMIDHENGHVAISEYYYANVDVYARQAAQAVMGKTFSGTGRDKQSAENDATHNAIQAIEKGILDHTRVRAVACNDRYDKLTDHGRNGGPQADAATQAENQDPEPKGGKP